MDPADSNSVQHALFTQGTLLGRHEHQLHHLTESNASLAHQVGDLCDQVATLTNQLSKLLSAAPPVDLPFPLPSPQPSSVVPPARESHISDPEPYSGDPFKCRSFLLQCSLIFSQKHISFASDPAKVQYIIGLLRGRALDWVTALWEGSPEFFLMTMLLLLVSFRRFLTTQLRERRPQASCFLYGRDSTASLIIPLISVC